MTRYNRIARDVFGRPWAILPSRMEAIVEVIELRAAGLRLSQDEIRERVAAAMSAAGPRGGAQGGQIAVIPVYGVLSHRMNLMSDMSGGTSVQQLTGSFRQAMADPSVSGIVFDVDSPGGSVEGIPELAAEMRAARGQKPMLAVSNSLMASAAYWLAAQADEIMVTPSSLTGSVGVLMAHEDYSAANEADGVTITYVYAGDHKVEGNPNAPLDDEARAYMQGLVDDVYGMFVADIAKGRGVAASAVRADFGKGRVMMPAEAVKAGMADRIGTLDDAVARVAKGKVGMRAESGVFTFSADSAGYLPPPSPVLESEHPAETEEPADGPEPSHVIALATARRRRRAIPA